MPTFGLLTQKRSTYNPKFENRYFITAADLLGAQVVASSIVDAENIMFGGQVVTFNTHVWRPNVSPNQFNNSPRSDAGAVPVSNAIADWICVEFLFGAATSSYINRKLFRVQVDDDMLLGREWSVAYRAILDDAAEAFSDLLGFMVTEDGGEINTVAYNTLYVRSATRHGWYNRTP